MPRVSTAGVNGLAFRKLAKSGLQAEQGGPNGRGEPHLRIPAEYRCRLRGQRKTGDSGLGMRSDSTEGVQRRRWEAGEKEENMRERRKEERKMEV